MPACCLSPCDRPASPRAPEYLIKLYSENPYTAQSHRRSRLSRARWEEWTYAEYEAQLAATGSEPARQRPYHLLETEVADVPELGPFFPHLAGPPLRPVAAVADPQSRGGSRMAEPVNGSDVRDLLSFFGMKEVDAFHKGSVEYKWPKPRRKDFKQKIMCACPVHSGTVLLIISP